MARERIDRVAGEGRIGEGQAAVNMGSAALVVGGVAGEGGAADRDHDPWGIPLVNRPAHVAGAVAGELGAGDGEVVVDVHRSAVAGRGVVVAVHAAEQSGGAVLDVQASTVPVGGVRIEEGVCQRGVAHGKQSRRRGNCACCRRSGCRSPPGCWQHYPERPRPP